MTRINLLLLTFCALLIAGVAGYKDYRLSNKIYFVIEMESSATGVCQLFFDTNQRPTGGDSTLIPVIRSGFYQKHSLRLPKLIKDIKSIRFDPIDKATVLRIKKAGIENAAGDTLKSFPIQSFKAVQQIDNMVIDNDVLVIQSAENANDPITIIENSSFERKSSSWVDFLVQHGWIYVGYFLLSFTVLMGLAKYRQQIAESINEFLERLFDYAVANPRNTIIFIGFFAAIVSCYPVIFFGKSFVHPVGVYALYSSPPWFPEFPLDAVSEAFRGTDLGPSAWSIAPNSVVQHNSLFRDFEFPFWNRYVGGGIPLFAQGYSLIGDVLHWIPVFLGESAIGWDIKFVLSKAIFAVGMGLLVFRLTDKLLAGVLITFSSCFLGFFAYRFNHPAYFVLTYAPWIVLQWDRFGRFLALPNPQIKSCVVQGFLLAVITWLQLNAGTPKEGVITACFVHALGIVGFLMYTVPKWGRMRSFVLVGGIGIALSMITAPYWLLFLDALGKAFTAYDTPSISTFPSWSIIGFFDNFFFQKYFNNYLTGPSVNLFVLFCMVSSFLSLRLRQSLMVYASWGLFIVAMAAAYGLIPVSILIAIPFINKIIHIGDTFSMPMMVLALIIAGYGIRDYLVASEKLKKTILIFSLSSFLGLWFISGLNEWHWKGGIFVIIIIFSITLIGFIQLYQYSASDVRKKCAALIILTCCFLVLHIRHGLHLMTGVEMIDTYVTNPTERPNFSNKSTAIEYIKNEMDKTSIPTRVIGEGYVLFPGFNARLGLEGIVPVEALRSKDYQKLLTLVDYPVVRSWGWLHLITNGQIESRAAALDFLGIGFMVTTPNTKMPQDMKLVHSSDLDVWQRPSVWPRAFFVNKIVEVHKPSDILEALADKARTPFAAVESQFIPQGGLSNSNPYQVVSAGEYKLTNNSIHFTIDASSSGIIVLGETYYPNDFVATVNGEKVDYIRVNEASKGIWVSKAGKYDVSFTYRPEKLNQALWICLFGLALLPLLIRMFVGIPISAESERV